MFSEKQRKIYGMNAGCEDEAESLTFSRRREADSARLSGRRIYFWYLDYRGRGEKKK